MHWREGGWGVQMLIYRVSKKSVISGGAWCKLVSVLYFSIFFDIFGAIGKKPHRRVAKLQFAPGAANHTFFTRPVNIIFWR